MPNILNNNEELNKSNNNIVKKRKNENKNIVELPYEFTERIIEALSCEYCSGILIRPYMINENKCEHIFCLRCIMKMLDNELIGKCFKCKTQFSSINIKYCEAIDFYVKTFFPQIPVIIEGYHKDLFDKMIGLDAYKPDEIYSIDCDVARETPYGTVEELED